MSERKLPPPPLQIPYDKLSRRGLGGFDRATTERMFAELAGYYEALWIECEALRERVARLDAEAVSQEDRGRLLGEALIDAKRAAVKIREEARREAELAGRKVRAKGEKAIRKAEREAKVKAAEILADARREQERLQSEIERVQGFAAETHEELSSFLLAALRWYKQAADRQEPMVGMESLEDALGESLRDLSEPDQTEPEASAEFEALLDPEPSTEPSDPAAA